MSAVSITVSDLAPFATIDATKAQAMIDDALALAARVAPCINDIEFEYPEAALATIRGAILRWNDAGSGAVVSTTDQAGPFMKGQTIDTKQARRGMFWPSEITDLAGLCADNANSGKAFEIDTMPPSTGVDGFWSAPDLWTPLP